MRYLRGGKLFGDWIKQEGQKRGVIKKLQSLVRSIKNASLALLKQYGKRLLLKEGEVLIKYGARSRT